MKKGFLYMLAAALMILPLSCHKNDDETETQPSLSGLSFSLDSFGGLGQTFVLTPSDVTTSDDTTPESVGHYWLINGGNRDTTDVFTFSPDTLGTYTIACYAFATGYYSTSASKAIKIIDPSLGVTLSQTGISHNHITVDGTDYFYTEAGGLEWFRNNLAVSTSGIPYLNAEITSAVLGRYYTWEEASTACPDGWRLPSTDEWDALPFSAGDLMVNAYFLEDRMWEYWPQVPITNASSLAVIPAGYALTGSDSPDFKGFEEFAAFWTSTPADDEDQAVYRYIYEAENNLYAANGDKTSLSLSVRCVR